MEDADYKYCYRNLLIESKEWFNTLKNLEDYMSGKSSGDTQQKSASGRGKSLLENFAALNFADEENMGEFMRFLMKYMGFTEKMIHLTIYFGDIVEQAIRYSNLQQFEKNQKLDDEKHRRKNVGFDVDRAEGDDFFSGADHILHYHRRADRLEEEHKKSRNANYKFMSIDQLKTF